MLPTRLGFALVMLAAPLAAQSRAPYQVRSPGGATEVTVTVGDTIRYAVAHRGGSLLAPSPIALVLADGRTLGRAARVRGARTRVVDTTLRPAVAVKNAAVRDHYAELRLDLDGSYALEVRAYDDGVAYRWVTALPESVTVQSEVATFRFGRAHDAIAGVQPVAASFMTHYEPTYARLSIDSVRGDRLGLLPFLVDVASGPKVAITESGLEDYAGMYVASGGDGTLVGRFPQAARAERARNDRDVLVTAREPYLARTVGRRAYPWRAILIADEDRQLLENELVYKLATPSRLTDVAWIRPGLVAWDWWNALNLRGVPFAAGVNTATYEYYIDFAAKYHIPYVILDEGWYKLGDLLAPVPAVDVPALVRYGEQKGVGVILWAIWKTLDDQMIPALDQFQRWGVRGVKVDFMQRDDQKIVNFYWRTAREAAARHLLLDFHGAHKPAGLNRAYPNVLSFEGVHGLENDKWEKDVTPQHDVTLPFTRMLAGPMDYTPGAMRNAQPKQFAAIYEHPMSQGTRVHQLAMYVVYESPLQMLADAPDEYLREPDAMAFLDGVPTTWDETRALDGKVGQYVLVARRRGDAWYVGAMTDGTPRELTLDLSFLGAGAWRMATWADGPNAGRNAMDYVRDSRRVAKGEKVTIRMAPGGGFVARFARGGA